MNILSWAEKRAQNLKWYHYGTLKIAVASAVLLLAKFIPELITFDWYWYVGVFVLTYVITLIGFFGGSKA